METPPKGCWKFNCDGTYNPSDNKSATFAVIVRDSNGVVMDVSHGRIKVLSALAAEASTLRVACSLASM
ncbi:hypothetical protein RHMOL_Rhmol09G0143100 [Rhododendron molle]|uniref:Uncharacterized protein n=1 Tax=Rhododendron molle TaxID=49168 RepID=A0ACC0MDH0_RHOML|nr:hypothetical protein RHMOL_Rhmol09G0143100 [Rhododendron molle]